MWIVYAFGAAVIWGLDYTLVQRLLGAVSFGTLLTIQFFVAFLVMLCISLFSGHYRADFEVIFSSSTNLWRLAVVVSCFCLGHTLIVLSISAKNATVASLIEMSYPFFVAIFTWLFFGQMTLNIWTIVGAGLVIIGLMLISTAI